MVFHLGAAAPAASAYFVCSNAWTLPGPASPVWTKVIGNLPPKTKIEWKCLRKRADGSWLWQDGPNSVHTTSDSGYSGVTLGHL